MTHQTLSIALASITARIAQGLSPRADAANVSTIVWIAAECAHENMLGEFEPLDIKPVVALLSKYPDETITKAAAIAYRDHAISVTALGLLVACVRGERARSTAN